MLRLLMGGCGVGGEIPAVGSLYREGRQDAAAIRAGVDADAVCALVHRVRYCMAVNDDTAMVLRVAEERVADPSQVLSVLLLHRDARADSGMDEQIISEGERIGEAL